MIVYDIKNSDEYIYDEDRAKSNMINNSKGKLAKIYHDYFCPKNRIGPCMEMCKKCKPNTLEEFYNYYISNGYPLSYMWDISVKMGNMFSGISDDDFTITSLMDTLIYHAVTETFYGYYNEFIVINAFEKTGWKIETSPTLDGKYHIDIMATNNDKKIFIQIKPSSFFDKTLKSDIIDDRKTNYFANKELLKKYPNSSCVYMIYDRNNRDKFIFYYDPVKSKFLIDIDDIFNPDGTSKELKNFILKNFITNGNLH